MCDLFFSEFMEAAASERDDDNSMAERQNIFSTASNEYAELKLITLSARQLIQKQTIVVMVTMTMSDSSF